MRAFVDTSSIVALLTSNDMHHREAAETLNWLRGESAELVTTNYVVIESLAVVRRKFGPTGVHRLIDDFLPLVRVIWVGEATHTAAIEAYRSAGGSASIVDRISFAIMRREGISEAFAFDTDFDAQGFDHAKAAALDPKRIHEEIAQYGTPSPAELVSVAEISRRAGRSINTIQSWRRRQNGFPTPVAQLAAGPIWSWPDVAEWIARRDRRTPRIGA